MLTTSRGASLSYSLAQGILEMISDRKLAHGDVLPNARSLAEHFEVTTPTIREALRTLEATGAVELRHGSGTYVGANVGRLVLPNPNGLTLTGDIRLQMINARCVIEPQIAELAALSRDGDYGLDALEESLESSDWAQPAAASPQLNFHRELARVAGNVVLYEVVDSLLSLRSREHREIRQMYDRKKDHAQHRAIYDAVKDRDAARAHALMHEHLSDIRAVVTEEAVVAQKEDPSVS
ncbi:FadR/GntR family transcriptional regulator [Paramicrobacterium agarici]|uniref:FadR/GntR family transcriptional regulator n=1 Tax=Paramicrobacterium agarici TaxID=630514 RepID=UPI00115382C8|nr:FCD domain-containing protein [Microbacterium agarici]TQO23305.1 DNA-binding FadR family transcriptional regulator [Microbacterium agarici]